MQVQHGNYIKQVNYIINNFLEPWNAICNSDSDNLDDSAVAAYSIHLDNNEEL